MTQPISGIHHVTAIASDPQRNADFYTELLGLRLVKKTVNFDDPGTYHLYFGDELGRPGTILTFFPWPNAKRGSRGSGQATVTSFSVSAGSLGFWQERLERHGVVAEDLTRRFDEEVLTFYDPDGLKLELVTDSDDSGTPWAAGPIPERHAIRGFHSVTLAVREVGPSAELLTTTMGFEQTVRDGDRTRFEAAPGPIARRVDLVHVPNMGRGLIAAGTVHHVAFRVPDDASQAQWIERLTAVGMAPTSVKDRQYFKSIYFREPAGVLFEFATDTPGFAWDEEVAELGTGLKLPPWLEPRRERIEGILPTLKAHSPADPVSTS